MAQDVLAAAGEQEVADHERLPAGHDRDIRPGSGSGDSVQGEVLSVRLKAHLCLGIMAGGFLLLEVLAWAGILRGGWSRLLTTAFEAGTVGAMADWFAVTALFREVRVPLVRLRLPLVTRHSNVIIRNRVRITESIVHTVQNQWLTPEAIRSHLAKHAPVDRMLAYFDTPQKVRSVLEQVRVQFIVPQASDVDQQQVASFLAREIRDQVQCLHLAQPLGRWAKQAIEQGEFDRIWDELQSENGFRSLMTQVAIPFGNVASIGKAIVETLIRRQAKQSLLKYASRLEHGDPATTRQFEDLWKGVVGSGRFHEMLLHGVNQFVADLLQQAHTPDSRLMQQIQSFLVHQMEDLRANGQKRQQWNERAIDELTRLIASQRSHVGGIVQAALEKPDDAQWCSQLEEKVGDDLQWIRINGAIVGMMVGFALGGVKLILSR